MENPVVSRNNVSKQLKEEVYGKTSDKAGQKFFAPVLNEPDFSSFTQEELSKVTNVLADFFWTGWDNVTRSTNKALRVIFMGINEDESNRNSDGTANFDSMAADWADFTAGQATLKDIGDEIEALSDGNLALFNKIEFDDANQPIGEEGLKAFIEMKSNGKKINVLKSKRDAIKAEYEKRAALRKANKDKVAVAA